VKNLKMRVESMSSRLDFDERRARALEGVVQYRPGAVPPLQPPASGPSGAGAPASEAEQAERRARRRRRRGRRRPDQRGGYTGGEAQGSAAPETQDVQAGHREQAAYDSAASREPADRGASEPNES